MDILLPHVTSCLDSMGLLNIFTRYLPGATGDLVELQGRYFQVLRLLGEGGYSFVYLARETTVSSGDSLFALKKVLAGTEDQLSLAKQEIRVMQALQHPNLMPLLASAVTQQVTQGVPCQVIYMLMPLFQDGSLFELITQQHARKQPLPAQDVLHIFLQVCSGVQAMHNASPPLAHRDIKPHNVLLQQQEQSRGAARQNGGHETQSLQAVGSTNFGRYHAVLMDFGSARPAEVHVCNRLDALRLQEDAEAHCTAPYKAPELYDVASDCSMDERVDVWSLGCLLYFCLYAISPFERVLNEAGGSLALAVINNNVTFPHLDGVSRDFYPQTMKDLVLFCLQSNSGQRPFVSDVLARTRALLQQAH